MADSTTLEPPALQETSSAIQPPPSTEAQNSVANMVDTSENNVGEQDTTMTGGQADSTKLEKLAETNSTAQAAAAAAAAATTTTTTTTATTTDIAGSPGPLGKTTETSSTSRAPSAVPTPTPAPNAPAPAPMPTEAAEHGAPTRRYLNGKVTPHVMEGMKMVALLKPADPLRMLGEFLLLRSAQVEGAGAAAPSAATPPVVAAAAEETKGEDTMNGVEQ